MSEVDERKAILFGGHSSGITNKKKKYLEWQHITAAVNAVASANRTVPDIKKRSGPILRW